jgi:hypothetical protein
VPNARLRKDFTVSERAAIGAAVEAAIGNRQRQRTDRLLQEIAEVPKGNATRQEAAEKSGFGNAETYRQAKAIVENGAPELIEAAMGERRGRDNPENPPELKGKETSGPINLCRILHKCRKAASN